MLRFKFEEQLKHLNASLVEMGELVKIAIAGASKALVDQDIELAKQIIDNDDKLDIMEKEIEHLCMKIIWQQQPVASDLRLVSAILKMLTDLERIGDQASDISEITILLADKKYIKKLEHIPQMAEISMKMVSDSIDAFIKKDLFLARDVITRDDFVDDLFLQVKNELIDLIKINAENCEQAVDLLMIAKYYERIGDHAENVAEWVVYSITGEHKNKQVM
jgi:phosphate transport system protein